MILRQSDNSFVELDSKKNSKYRLEGNNTYLNSNTVSFQ